MRFHMRKLIVVFGMLLMLNTACTDKVSYIQSDQSEEATETDEDTAQDTELDSDTDTDYASDDSGQSDEIAVYVCGAVNAPGVYYFTDGDIASAALEAAGGLADGAATDYVNLAEKLQDGEKLYFPYEEEVETGDIKYDSTSGGSASSTGTSSSEDTSSGKVNINTADKTELMTLPGIGESKAALIIDYRETNGSFSSIEDIMNISGIKDGVYSKIKDYITVD